MYGRYDALQGNATTLAGVLRTAGYETAGFLTRQLGLRRPFIIGAGLLMGFAAFGMFLSPNPLVIGISASSASIFEGAPGTNGRKIADLRGEIAALKGAAGGGTGTLSVHRTARSLDPGGLHGHSGLSAVHRSRAAASPAASRRSKKSSSN